MKNNLSIRINLGTKPVFGHGKAALLESIEKSGSISAAARNLRMSYRRAWMLTDSMNNNFKKPLIKSKLGGKGGGGRKDLAQAGGNLTDNADKIYNEIKKEVLKLT